MSTERRLKYVKHVQETERSPELDSLIAILPSSSEAVLPSTANLMASAIHATQPQYNTPPSFSRDSTASSVGGVRLSQTGISPFEPSHSFVSTPTETPPPSRGRQHQMPFNMGNYGTTNGMHLQQGAPRGLAESNGRVTQQQPPLGHKPQIYTVGHSLY